MSELDPMFKSDWKPTAEYKRRFYWESTYDEEWIEGVLELNMNALQDPDCNCRDRGGRH